MGRMPGMVAAVSLALVSVASAQPAQEQAAAARWLQANGHQLSSAEPSKAELTSIVDRLRGARVIGLGEVTHGTHEDVAFKALLLRELVTAGAIDTLAIEANRVVGVGFDRYVRNGVGDPAALVMSPSTFRIFKNDEFSGALLWLRAWNLAHPDRIIGVTAIDDQDGAVDAAFALEVVARHDRSLAARLREGFRDMIPPPGAPRVRPSDWIAQRTAADAAQMLAAAEALSNAFAAHASEWNSDPDFTEAAYAARVTVQNILIFQREVKGADLKTLSPDYGSRRDRFMAENLLERLGVRKRAALWAHDDHVIHTYPAAWTQQGYTSLGHELRLRLDTGYRTVGFTYTRALALATRGDTTSLTALMGPQTNEAIPLDNSGAQTSGSVLTRLPGNAWWFDTSIPVENPSAARWLARPVWEGRMGWLYDPARFQKTDVREDSVPLFTGYDIIVWFRTMTPQHRWPSLPAPPA